MSHLNSHQQTTTTIPTTDARKLANKQRRKAGRERHDERKIQLKALASDRRWQRLERDSRRQEKRPDDGTRAFVGRSPDNHRVACSHLHPSATATEGRDQEEEEEEEESRGDGQVVDVSLATSGAMLLAMARPAKIHRGRRRHRPSMLEMTNGELFEVVEIEGRLVALDEDGWEILPDENAEASVLYSDIVRGDFA